ncbi:flagellar biosynthesis repressor FlbT [Cognatishimia sp. SS12]|uniref:flagellar biosynthesis repressor FlbT n=1 Tax=Cognatishimia sp. SS12 TaxID=2979465 RepID=UPI00232E42BF|nr:flagellar biosynthesis repressor FlbT [Cognatishimia sp. SS12]MDC0739424.1 flagellar biosynthesis repressor FlbT [Cognatishimia sp. SS12]
MALRLTLKPNEKIVINGCVIRNADRRQLLTIENHADIVRGVDLLDDDEAGTPVKNVYFFIQTALLNPPVRDELVPVIQKDLAALVPIFHEEIGGHIFEAANHVSCGDYYKAMRALRPLMKYEADLLEMINGKAERAAAE